MNKFSTTITEKSTGFNLVILNLMTGISKSLDFYATLAEAEAASAKVEDQEEMQALYQGWKTWIK